MEILVKECLQLFKRDHLHLIIEVSVVCSRDDKQFFIVPGQLTVGRFAEIAGMGLLSMNEEYSRADLVAVLQDRHIQEGQ